MLLNAVLITVALSAQAPAPTTTPAPAADVQSEVERIYAEGAALYKSGKYRAAVEKFEQAYALYPEPNLLFNMGRAYEALGELDQAILKFKLCARHPQAAADVAARARDKLAVLEAAQANSAATPAPAPATTTTTTAPTTTTTTPAPAPAAAAAPPPSGAPVLAIAGGVIGVVGIVAGGVGGVFYGLGSAAHGEVEAAKDGASDGVASLSRVEAQRLVDEGAGQKTLGVSLLVGGAVGLVVGGALVVVDLASE